MIRRTLLPLLVLLTVLASGDWAAAGIVIDDVVLTTEGGLDLGSEIDIEGNTFSIANATWFGLDPAVFQITFTTSDFTPANFNGNGNNTITFAVLNNLNALADPIRDFHGMVASSPGFPTISPVFGPVAILNSEVVEANVMGASFEAFFPDVPNGQSFHVVGGIAAGANLASGMQYSMELSLNPSVTGQVVPEPSALVIWSVLGLAGIGTLVRVQRRKTTK